MSQPITIDAELTGELSAPLRLRAERYRDHVRASGEEAVKAFEELAGARREAAHGEWGLFLRDAGIDDTTARVQLQLYEQMQADPRFGERFRQGWLTQGAGRELLSAPAEVKDEILSRPAESKPPTVAEVREAKKAATPSAKRATSHDSDGNGAASTPAVAAAATPEPAGEVIASMPAEPTPEPAPAPSVAAAATPALTATSLEVGVLKNQEALVALLEQTLNLAQSERDRLQRSLPDVHFELPDAAVELAAQNLLSSSALRVAANFLAMNAREPS